MGRGREKLAGPTELGALRPWEARREQGQHCVSHSSPLPGDSDSPGPHSACGRATLILLSPVQQVRLKRKA